MKTAISLPNDLFALAEEFAKIRGMSRSELYAIALREYINAHSREKLTERINAVCAVLDTTLSADMAQTARQKLLETEW